MNTTSSPYLQHAELVLGDYGAGDVLRSFVLSLYSGRLCDLSRVRLLDNRHRAAFLEILSAYMSANESGLAELVGKIHARYPGQYR